RTTDTVADAVTDYHGGRTVRTVNDHTHGMDDAPTLDALTLDITAHSTMDDIFVIPAFHDVEGDHVVVIAFEGASLSSGFAGEFGSAIMNVNSDLYYFEDAAL